MKNVSKLAAALALGSALGLSACSSTSSMGPTAAGTGTLPGTIAYRGPTTLASFYSTVLYRGAGYNDYGATPRQVLYSPRTPVSQQMSSAVVMAPPATPATPPAFAAN